MALTNPPPGFIYYAWAIVRLKATASDADGTVQRVDFYGVLHSVLGSDSTNLLGTVFQPPYNLVLTNVPDLGWASTAALTAVATDDHGASSTSAPPVVVVFAQAPRPPVVTITQPKDGDVFSTLDVLTLAANVVAYDGTENPLYFFSDDQLIGSVAPPPYSLAVSNLPAGEQLLTARYTDDIGNLTISGPVKIVVKPFSLLSARFSSAGQFSFTVQGLVTGNYFQVEASSNLLNWFPVSSNIAVSNTFRFVEPTPASLAPRFYRGSQQVR